MLQGQILMFKFFYAPCNNLFLMVGLCSLLWYNFVIQTSIDCVLYIFVFHQMQVYFQNVQSKGVHLALLQIPAELRVKIQNMQKQIHYHLKTKVSREGERSSIYKIQFSPKTLIRVCLKHSPVCKHWWWCVHPSCFLPIFVVSCHFPKFCHKFHSSSKGKISSIYFCKTFGFYNSIHLHEVRVNNTKK